MLRNRGLFFCLFFVFFSISALAAPVDEQSVFNERLLIGEWHFRFLHHLFDVAGHESGRLAVIKSDPSAVLKGGFFILNGKFISLYNFLTGTEAVFENDTQLKSNILLAGFLRGPPGGSIISDLIKKNLIKIFPPEITEFYIDPQSIPTGSSSTLIWRTTNSNSCVIEPGIGPVDASGSLSVYPTEMTTYTLTATGEGGTSTASVTVTIINTAPTAISHTVATKEDTPVPITLTGADPDTDTLVFQVDSQPIYGTLSGTPPAVTYAPNENFNGSDSFTFSVSDGQDSSGTATITIMVSAVNDAPVANPQSVSFDEDSTVQIDLSAIDTDGDLLTYEIVQQPVHGGLSGTAPNLIYQPEENYYGSDVFAFKANDVSLSSKPAEISLTIHSINDSPTADAGLDRAVFVRDAVTLNGSASRDVENVTLTYQWAFTSLPQSSQATLSDQADVKPSFTADKSGSYEIQLIVSDGQADSLPGSVTITADYRMVDVPDVVGMNLTEAKAAISGINLAVGWINTVKSDLIPNNQVVEQTPPSATSVPENAAMDMVISLHEDSDDDSDGLADAWEYEKFGNLDQSTDDDSDADGYSNYQEYLIGTDPKDPGEAPVPAGNFYEYDEFGRIISKQITLEPEYDNGEWRDDSCEGIDCGEDTCGSYGNWYCQDENIRRRDRTCIDRGCTGGSCYEYNFTDYEPEFCSDGCIDGVCVTYSWYTGACNVPCGGGTRPVYCRRSDGVQVDDNLCAGSKPSASCNAQECPEVCYYEPGNGGTYFYESCRVKCTEYEYGWEGIKKVPVGCLTWTLDCYWQLHFNDNQLVFELNERAPETYEKNGYRYQKGAVMREPSCDPHDLSCNLYRHWWGVTTTRLCKNCGGCN